MSSRRTEQIPSHSNRTFLNTSDLNSLLKSGRPARVSHSLNSTTKSYGFRHTNQEEDQLFSKTSSKLANLNFSHHHNADVCLCNDCSCGRHQCKLKVVKPELTKTSVYQRSFYQKQVIPNIVNHDKEYEKLKGDHLDMNSVYLESFRGKDGDKIEKPHPEDILKKEGPTPLLTSYTSQFPGYRGDNQYVKPTDKHSRAYFPMRSKSSYANEFSKKEAKKDDYTYHADQLKTGANWYGKTTYGSFYSNPNPEYQAKKVKVLEKRNEKLPFNHQYETVYKNDFIPKENPLCPAKVYLETKGQGSLVDSKHNFAENSDFKSLSPEFHAISTSKHSYV